MSNYRYMYEYEYSTIFTLTITTANVYKNKIDGYPMFT